MNPPTITHTHAITLGIVRPITNRPCTLYMAGRCVVTTCTNRQPPTKNIGYFLFWNIFCITITMQLDWFMGLYPEHRLRPTNNNILQTQFSMQNAHTHGGRAQSRCSWLALPATECIELRDTQDTRYGCPCVCVTSGMRVLLLTYTYAKSHCAPC